MDTAKIYERKYLERYYISYLEIVNFMRNVWEIRGTIIPDHLGCQTGSGKEFDEISRTISKYSTLIKETYLQKRRIAVFKFDTPLLGTMLMPKIEIFEPKPEDNVLKLKYGIEHISFYVPEWELFVKENKNRFPIAKEGEVNNSKFIKTLIINNVEIEFRNDRLGEEE